MPAISRELDGPPALPWDAGPGTVADCEMGPMTARHLMLPSPAMGRRVHLWCYGETGRPLLVFPSAAGIAHE